MATVLCCSGHDPTGGAGIQADIEAVAAQGAHALALVTALTVQDTRNVRRGVAVDAALLAEQLEVLLADCTPDAIKLGLIGDAAQLPVLAGVLRASGRPVVIDPVLRAGGGRELVGQSFAQQLAQALFPLCTVLTPNAAEARALTGCTSLDAAGAALLAMGVAHVLITGGDEPDAAVHNLWFHRDGRQRFTHPRIAGGFHGAGCTLAASIAARLALGDSIEAALANAQLYVAGTLAAARAIGQGRRLPWRVRPAGLA